ncbi:branched-chain amino acid ABC transporter permease [soil metagenome]
MTKFLQTLLDSLSVGSLYALIALGYTMVYGTLKFINFAHSTVFMLGAWASLIVAKKLGAALGWPVDGPYPPYAAALVVLIVITLCALLGVTIERLAYRPLRNAPRLNVLITAIGVALLLENVAALPSLIGTEPSRMPSLISDKPLASIGAAGGNVVNINPADAWIIILAVVLMAGLQFLIFRTKLGNAMRAVSQDSRTASLMGINVDKTISITFLIGSGLAGAAGFLFAAKYPGLQQPAYSGWALLGLKAFVAAVVGGIGKIRGAMLGGLLIAMAEQFGSAYVSTQLRDVYVFSILIAVLLFMPSGIMGKSVVEKV